MKTIGALYPAAQIAAAARQQMHSSTSFLHHHTPFSHRVLSLAKSCRRAPPKPLVAELNTSGFPTDKAMRVKEA